MDQAAHRAICDLKARYCRLLDTKDWPGFAALLTEDFELDTRDSGGTLVHGRDAVVAMVRASIDTARTAHHIHAPELDGDGDHATGIWAMQDRVIFGPERLGQSGLISATGYGHYHERYVRQGAHWLIAASRLTRLHIDLERAAAG